MHKIFIIFIILPSFIFASYNPFFSDDQAPAQTKTIQKTKVIIQQVQAKPIPARKSIDMEYIGFIETKKGKFALVTFNKKNIVIRKNDSLYIDEKVFKIQKITSNYILLKDRHYRMQTVYFSSQRKNSNYGSTGNNRR